MHNLDFKKQPEGIISLPTGLQRSSGQNAIPTDPRPPQPLMGCSLFVLRLRVTDLLSSIHSHQLFDANTLEAQVG